MRNHSRTTWHISSERNFLPPRASCSGPNIWKSLGARSGEYGGCGRYSNFRSIIVATVAWAVWGCALSCRNRIPVHSNPRHFDLIAGWRWYLRRSEYDSLVIVVPHDMCSKMTPFSSQKRVSIAFPADGFVLNFFGLGWWGMAPFLTCSLCFWLVVVNPRFVPGDDSC